MEIYDVTFRTQKSCDPLETLKQTKSTLNPYETGVTWDQKGLHFTVKTSARNEEEIKEKMRNITGITEMFIGPRQGVH
jgi:hypothetical protein